MKPHVEGFKKALEKEGIRYVKFYEVNCEEEDALCEKFGVESFPELKIFDFEGELAA